MRYLLCEDSAGGFTFWESVNRLLLGGYFDVVDHSAGRGGLKKKIESLLPLIIQGNIGPRIDLELQDELITLTGGKRVNKEKFYARLLGMLIDNGLGQFSFTKHEPGDDTNTSCWFNDCCELRISSGCQSMCGIPFDMTTASERLLCLFENSLLKNREFGLKLIEKAHKGAIK